MYVHIHVTYIHCNTRIFVYIQGTQNIPRPHRGIWQKGNNQSTSTLFRAIIWQDQPQRLWLPIQAGWTWNHWNHELQIALNFGTLNHPVSRVNDLCRPFHSRLRLSQSMQSQERSFATALTRIQLLAYINMDAKTKSSSRVSDMIFVPVNQFFRGKTTIPHHSTSKRATTDH